MLGWIFRKKDKVPTPAPRVATQHAPPAAAPQAPAVDWPAQLARAHGDDDALLALVRAAGTPLQFKQAAVEALQGEAALKLAEREFRSHDRRVHQLAKRRLLEKVAQRQTREQAAHLIETARRLVGEADLPVNRGVELDHAWQALDSTAIEPGQRSEFAALTARLAALARQGADAELQRKRWHSDVAQAAQHLRAACTDAAAGTQDRLSLAAAARVARGVLAAPGPGDAPAPTPSPPISGLLEELQHTLVIAGLLDDHLAVLERLLASTETRDEAEAQTEVAPSPEGDPLPQWQALAPLPDAPLAALLEARHARWQQARDQARRDRLSQRREHARERQRALRDEQHLALADGVTQAETALDAGQLADAQRLLSDIDDALQGVDAPEALRARIAAGQARLAQLRGWQHWAGGRARDELVLQAEALAAATVAGGAGQGSDEADEAATAADISQADADVARLSIRQRADVIATLRTRWKELDRLGDAGSRALWLRFDTALKTANEPVAAHAAAQRAARENNLAARRQLLDALEAVPLAGPAASSSAALPAEADSGSPAEAPFNTHSLATALERFQLEWRKLGPLEHTVPRAACAATVERMAAAVQRVELPLQAARQQAHAQRQALLARARTLAGDAATAGHDLVGEARMLQAEWQRHAKALPLARRDEQALWSDFKAAIDAAFAARETVFSAREAEFTAHATEREALIERLRVRPEDSLAAQRRTLSEVDAAWQRCGPAPRARAAALDAQFRDARQALRQWLDDAARRSWHATCDTLDAKLALCMAREQGAADAADPATAAAAWQALPALPAPLEDALRRRFGLEPGDDTRAAPAIDDLLLQMETAWDLPTPPAFESARRERKLLAMKAALEGRRAAVAQALPPDAALALVLGHSSLDAAQRDRLAGVLAAWRRLGPQRPAAGISP